MWFGMKINFATPHPHPYPYFTKITRGSIKFCESKVQTYTKHIMGHNQVAMQMQGHFPRWMWPWPLN